MNSNDRLLRLALRGNAGFSAISGLLSVLAAEPLAAALGVPESEILTGLGVQLLVFAAFLVWLSARRALHPGIVLGVIVADLAWVIGTVPVVLAGFLTPAGVYTALGIADFVLLFAILQAVGLRRVRRVIAA